MGLKQEEINLIRKNINILDRICNLKNLENKYSVLLMLIRKMLCFNPKERIGYSKILKFIQKYGEV